MRHFTRLYHDTHELLIRSEVVRQEGSNKSRLKYQELLREMTAAQAGHTSGCGCPIGVCARRNGDAGSCWILWAEAHVLKRMANMRIQELTNYGHHPRRFTGQVLPAPFSASDRASGPAESPALEHDQSGADDQVR